MKLYLVVGENHMGEQRNSNDFWGICGIFKEANHAWSCPIPGFNHIRVIEIETDLLENEIEYSEIPKEKRTRMLRPA